MPRALLSQLTQEAFGIKSFESAKLVEPHHRMDELEYYYPAVFDLLEEILYSFAVRLWPKIRKQGVRLTESELVDAMSELRDEGVLQFIEYNGLIGLHIFHPELDDFVEVRL